MIDYDTTIVLDSNHSSAYYNRGRLKGYLHDYKGAIEDCDKAIAIQPKNIYVGKFKANIADVYFNRGLYKSAPKNFSGAIDDFDKAIELIPVFTEIHEIYLNRGNCKLKVGDKNAACEDWNKALELGGKRVKTSIEKYCK
ncbi:MAG: tetratricopeptide repeat protein [Ignavibacteria bacterium]|nr:tetratricopeptide repeat protein [Ignavibacteria bacterium]